MLINVKSFEIFPKQKEYFFISKLFALNWCIFVALKNKKLLLSLECKLKQSFLFNLEKLIEYWASAVSVVSSNSCVDSLPRIKIFPYYQYAQMSSYQLQK